MFEDDTNNYDFAEKELVLAKNMKQETVDILYKGKDKV